MARSVCVAIILLLFQLESRHICHDRYQIAQGVQRESSEGQCCSAEADNDSVKMSFSVSAASVIMREPKTNRDVPFRDKQIQHSHDCLLCATVFAIYPLSVSIWLCERGLWRSTLLCREMLDCFSHCDLCLCCLGLGECYRTKCGLKGLACGKCVAMGLEVQNRTL